MNQLARREQSFAELVQHHEPFHCVERLRLRLAHDDPLAGGELRGEVESLSGGRYTLHT